MLKTNHLRYFVAAAETGSLSSAGTSLNISTSSIGHAINVLEQDLQTSLFVRRPASGVVLTTDGRKLLTRAKQILLDVDNLEMDFTSSDDEIKGSLVVGCQESLAWSLVPRALYKVRSIHPKLEVIVKPLWMSTSLEPLDTGEVDILLSFTMGAPTDKKYAYEFLCRPRFCAMIRKGHPLDRGGQNVSLKDLTNYPNVANDDISAMELLLKIYDDHNVASPEIIVVASSSGAQSLVGCSDAVSLRCFRSVSNISPIGDELIHPILEDNPPAPVVTALMIDTQLKSAVRKREAFLEVCRELFSSGEMKKHAYY